MAQEHYTLQQTLEKLALTEEQLQGLVREGRIREFRVEGKAKYSAKEIDELAAELNPSFGSGDASDPGSESALDLLPVDQSDGASDMISLDESGTTTPVGRKGKSEDTVITAAGVSVFDEDELAGLDADPMAKTQIAPSVSDEVSIDGGGGSGSGLLDLSRESDDTSLGGVLDEIYSGEETMPEGKPGTRAAAEVPDDGMDDGLVAAPTPSRVVAWEVVDPLASVWTALLVAAMVLFVVIGLAAGSLIAGVKPGLLAMLGENVLWWFIGAWVVVLAAGGVGFFLSKR